MGMDCATRYRTAPARPAVRYRRVRAPVVVALSAALVLGACGGGGGGGDATTTAPPAPDTSPEAAAVTALPPPPAGQARVVLGSALDATLDVETCTLALDARPDGEVPSEQVVVEASGEADSEPVSLSVRRYRSPGASPTITDTIRVTRGPADAPTSVLEAQRFEVDGVVTDPRQPDADDPLLRIADDAITARARFAAPGSFAEDGGLVEGVVAVSCAG